MTSKNLCKLGKQVMLILLILSLTSIMQSCLKSQVEFVPFESNSHLIQKLPNGNWEVKADMIIDYQKVLLTGIKYKLMYQAALEEIKELKSND
jgi:hypothetical protein